MKKVTLLKILLNAVIVYSCSTTPMWAMKPGDEAAEQPGRAVSISRSSPQASIELQEIAVQQPSSGASSLTNSADTITQADLPVQVDEREVRSNRRCLTQWGLSVGYDLTLTVGMGIAFIAAGDYAFPFIDDGVKTAVMIAVPALAQLSIPLASKLFHGRGVHVRSWITSAGLDVLAKGAILGIYKGLTSVESYTANYEGPSRGHGDLPYRGTDSCNSNSFHPATGQCLYSYNTGVTHISSSPPLTTTLSQVAWNIGVPGAIIATNLGFMAARKIYRKAMGTHQGA